MRKFVSLLLAFALSLTMIFSGIAVSAEKPTYNYVSLGASNTNGYGLHGYLEETYYEDPTQLVTGVISGYRMTPEGTYPDLIRDRLEEQGYTVNFSQLAQSSMRTDELRVLLDDTYTGDSYTAWRYLNVGGWWDGKLADLRADYRQSIQQADLITYDFGINNFGTFVTNAMFSDLFAADIDALIINEKQRARYEEFRGLVSDLVAEIAGDADTVVLTKLIDTLSYALFGYCVNFDYTIKAIRDLNPNAQLVVVSIQNVMADVDVVYDGTKIPLGDIFGAMINTANVYTASISPYCDSYLYADVREGGRCELFLDELLRYTGNPEDLSVNMKDCYNVYDMDLCMKTRLTALLQQQGIEKDNPLYDVALNAAYDTLTRLFMEVVKDNEIPLDNFDTLLTNKSATEDALMDAVQSIVIGAVNTAVQTAVGGGTVTYPIAGVEEAVAQMLATENAKFLANFGVRTSIGNTFFAHPSNVGYQQVADLIMETLEKGTTGKEAVIAAFLGDDALDSVFKPLMVNALEKFAKVSRWVLAGAHVHTPVYTKKVAATCTTDGHKAYYTCTDCGKVFSNLLCTNEIETPESLVLPATGHKIIAVRAHNATLLTKGNLAYYRCSHCGECYSDSQGLQKIDDISAYIIPRKTLKSLFGRR